MFNHLFFYQKILGLAVNNLVDNRSILNTFIILSILILISFRKTIKERPLSISQTNQMKGIAILIIIVHHVSLALNGAGYLSLLHHLGFPSVSIFLVLSGYGVFLSIEKKGLNNFFSKRVMRVYIPFVLAMTGKILIFDYFILNERSRVMSSFVNMFVSPATLDMNMWFIVYILFWYCITYVIFSLNKSNKSKIFYLFLTGILVGISPAPETWVENSFSFPFGCWIAANSRLIIEKLESLLAGEKPTLSSIFHPAKEQLNNYIETFTLYLSFSIVCLHLWVWMKSPSPSANIYSPIINIIAHDIIGISFSILIIGLVILLGKFKIRSTFLNFLGENSFELYLVHGTLLTLFRLMSGVDFAVIFFVYFIIVCVSSIVLKKLNSFVSDLLLKSIDNS
ncbi:MAG: acyltransferase [Oscillatoriales cyanobacterium]|nr:MAG: acyltransferase [Oscillatoriales cyanobacterium]TAH20692.1 MAG: acyltransferase [Oscillatoriales cyanobacterium]